MSVSTGSILSSTKIADSTDQSKVANIDLSGATTSTSTSLVFNQTTNRTISFPDNSGTVALTSDLPEIQTGTQTSVSHTTNPVTTSFTFGSAFSSAPTVSLAIKNYTYLERTINPSTSSITTTGFNAVVNIDNYADKALSVVDSGLTGFSAGTWLEFVEGKPCIIYWHPATNSVRFARNSKPDGSGTWDSYLVETLSQIGRYPIFRVIDGIPIACYWHNNSFNLRFTKCSTSDGTGSWTFLTAIVGFKQYITMEKVNGALCVAYKDNSDSGKLKFSRNANADGSGAWTTYEVDTVGNADSFMKVVDGFPAIAYRRTTTNDCMFVRATNSSGTAWGTPVVVDAQNGKYVSMEIVNGFPALAYITDTGEARYAINDQANGSGTWTVYTVDADGNGDAVLRTSLSIIDGNPAITYMNDANTLLKYARSVNKDGTGSWIITTVDNTAAQVGQWPSMTTVNGNVGISYIDVTNSNVKFAYGTFNAQYDIDYVAIN